MKTLRHIFFALISILFCPILQAQTISGFFPPLGDTIIMASQASNIPYTPGGNGPGQTWVFSSFLGTGTDTIVFTDPALSPYAASYPSGSVFASESLSGSDSLESVIYRVDGSGAMELGQVMRPPEGLINVPFDSDLTWLQFPSGLGSWFQDTTHMQITVVGSSVGMSFADSVHFERTVYRTDTIGASGSLLLSSGYYPSVLRKTTRDHLIDSIYAYTASSGWSLVESNDQTSVNHYWIDPNEPYSLAELRLDNGYNRSFRARPYDPGSVSYYLEFSGMTPTLTGPGMYPSFTVNVRNISDGLIATGYSTDSIHISSGGYVNGGTAEWADNGTASFDSLFFYQGGDVQLVAYASGCRMDTFVVHVITFPDSLVFVNVPAAVNRAETVPSFQVLAYNSAAPYDTAQLNTESLGSVNIGKISGAGAISGTVTRPFVNGVATFDDISFNYADDYELVAYQIDIPWPDTAAIHVNAGTKGSWVFNRVDTLSEYVDRATWFSWWGGYQGFSTGPSRIPLWTDIGQQFDFDGSGRITQVMLHASYYQHVGPEEDSITVRIYDAAVNRIFQQEPFPSAPLRTYYVDSLAKHLLGTTYIRQDSLIDISTSELFNQRPIRWPLADPIEVHGPFVLTVQLNYAEGGVNDTLVLQQSDIGNGMGEYRNSRKVVNTNSGIADGTWLPEYMAHAFSVSDYDFMFEPILEVDSFQVGPVGLLNRGSQEIPIRVFPVPSSNFVFLSGFTSVPQRVTVTDMLGREIQTSFDFIDKGRIRFNITELTDGLYFINVYGKWGLISRKMIKRE